MDESLIRIAAYGHGSEGRHSLAAGCHALSLLRQCGMPVAFVRQDSAMTYLAPRCTMLPRRATVRRAPSGVQHLWPRVLVEFPVAEDGTGSQAACETLARRAFLALEKAWQLEGCVLKECAFGFATAADGRLMIAEAMDQAALRVLEAGKQIGTERSAELAARFRVPIQRVLVWCGFGAGDPKHSSFQEYLGELSDLLQVEHLAATANPIAAITRLQRLAHEVPDSVIIAYTGRSDGTGQLLAAATTLPVIAVPADYAWFREDVWSALRISPGLPLMTVLEPRNAVQAALNILALRSPRVYAHVREQVEARTVNVISI